MTVAHDIVAFLRNARAFASAVDPLGVALNGGTLDAIVHPSIRRAGDNDLRPAQVAAFEGLSRLRAGLVLGPPGTGKTHLASWLVLGHLWARTEAGLGSKVFLTAFTRSAIETLLAGVAKRAGSGPCQPSLVYLGTPKSPLAKNVRCIASLSRGADDLKEALEQQNVVFATTIWGLNSAILEGCLGSALEPAAPFFDLVAIDEASQMVLGQGLMALAGMAPECRVVVAGDDRQLPPIRSALGMKIDGREVGGSLYDFLKVEGVPEFALDETFRLNDLLTSFPEKRFYPGIYRSAVPERRLALAAGWDEGLDDLDRAIVDPAHPTVVLVHDGPSAATRSPFEVEFATRILSRFRPRMLAADGAPYARAGFWLEGMAVISPHRMQNAAMRARIGDGGQDTFVDTVDRIQGRERDAVILTYTVSDPEFALAEAEFIFSPQRLNVAITRARSKLVVIISRRLLDVVPPRQENLDDAETLREFVFSVPAVAEHEVRLAGMPPVRIQLRAQGRGSDPRDERPAAVAAPAPAAVDARALAILEQARRLCRERGRDAISLNDLQKVISIQGGLAGAFAEARRLHDLGCVSLKEHESKFKAGETYWMVAPFEHRRRVTPLDDPALKDRIRQDVYRDNVPYHALRDAYAWIAAEWPGGDLLRGVVDEMVEAGEIRTSRSQKGAALLSPSVREEAAVAKAIPPGLKDADFLVLNALEDLEAERIASGIVEAWSDVSDLERRCFAPAEASVALTRLSAAGHIMLAADGRLRSRMAELARELRYVKQRFRPDDAARRPYLVRSLKVLLRDRVKPRQDVPIAEVFGPLKARHGQDVRTAFDGLHAALAAIWGADARLAGFQARSFGSIFEAWVGSGDDAFVISADTGSGKTEAAILPMIAGACLDAMKGVRGTRAILAYPRVRLAANQSQRLARYLAALARMPGMPTLTLGVQYGDVPSSWRMGSDEAEKTAKAGWEPVAGAWRFPVFACPANDCGSPLELVPGAGRAGADRLRCTTCSWSFDGWIGTKRGLREKPPAFFLPTMDSLHQWLQTASYGPLFGDGGSSAPRAFMADEIHLYAYTHGAQVAYAMRRLLERCRRNDPAGRACLAIGMSATLGDPAEAFGGLVGREAIVAIHPEESETPVNPRGREYFFFIQPEVESRERDVAGASTTIQSLMCLNHGMRRRQGDGAGFRAIVFFDSIDRVRRLHSAYDDAERNGNLSSLRTIRYGDDPLTGRLHERCCGEPASCGRFADGECWYFAATDASQVRADGRPWHPGRPLSVARSPVSSGAEGAIEKMIKTSDVVFATSSLEVGYDDPDIALVYQHYGPQNLASFIQRKGRGGRSADDRPTTAVTLSIYKPRDTYWFDRPELMLDAKGFRAPLNVDNHFVRRGQLLSHFLDGLALWENETSSSPWLQDGTICAEGADAASDFVETIFGERPWEAYGFPNMRALWAAAPRVHGDPILSARDARRCMPWLPEFLHDAVDLPSVEVVAPRPARAVDADIQLAFSMLAPGNITRRFDRYMGLWRPPVAGLGPWFAEADYAACETFRPCGSDPADLVAELPSSVRMSFAAIGPTVLRPSTITLERAGSFSEQWLSWDPAFEVDEHDVVVPTSPTSNPAQQISHEGSGRLEGCAIVRADDDAAESLPPPAGVVGLRDMRFFVGQLSGARSGLEVTHVAWGSEAVLRKVKPGLDPTVVRQTFCDPRDGRPTLHGFRVETEGVRLFLDEDALDDFVAAEIGRGDDDGARWRRMHMARCSALLRLDLAGVNRFEAERIAVLIGAMASLPSFDARVVRMKRFPSVDRIAEWFEEVRSLYLACDPLLTKARVAAAAELIVDGELGTVLRDVLRDLDDATMMGRYIRSCILNGLALRWRQLFVTIAQGDERRVGVHCKLPILHGEGPAVITIAEAGQSGDGSTRAFRAAVDRAWKEWTGGFAASCPNAREDEVVDRFFADRSRHAQWRSTSQRDVHGLAAIASALDAGATLPTSIARILFDHHVVGGEVFGAYEVASALYDDRATLEARIGRPASSWEAVSAATACAAGDPVLAGVVKAFEAVPDADGEGSRSARSRFADLAYRVGSRLCTDGCRACMHQDGGPLHGLLAEATVSRTLTARYLVCD